MKYYLGSRELRDLINGSPNFSQKELADHLGITQQQVNNILTGRTKRPFNTTLKGIGEYLGMALDRDSEGIYFEVREGVESFQIDVTELERNLVEIYRRIKDERVKKTLFDFLKFYSESGD